MARRKSNNSKHFIVILGAVATVLALLASIKQSVQTLDR